MIFEAEGATRRRAIPWRGPGALPAASAAALLLLAVVGAGCTSPDDAAAGQAATPPPDSAVSMPDTLAMSTLADTLPPAEAARQAFRGRDLDGKDGPMAKIGYDLAHLYFAYRAHQRDTSGVPFEPPGGGGLRVAEGRVLIDATASPGGASRLKAALDTLGLEGGASAGSVVSGRLPVEALAEAARLPSLRAMRPSRPAMLN